MEHFCQTMSQASSIKVGWPSLSVRRQIHWIIFVCKAIIGQLPSCLSAFMSTNKCRCNLHSNSSIQLDVLIVRSEYGKAAFSYSAPSAWNDLQKHLKLEQFISLSDLKIIVKELYHSVLVFHLFFFVFFFIFFVCAVVFLCFLCFFLSLWLVFLFYTYFCFLCVFVCFLYGFNILE